MAKTAAAQRNLKLAMIPEPAQTELREAEITDELLAICYVIFERGRIVGREEAELAQPIAIPATPVPPAANISHGPTPRTRAQGQANGIKKVPVEKDYQPSIAGVDPDFDDNETEQLTLEDLGGEIDDEEEPAPVEHTQEELNVRGLLKVGMDLFSALRGMNPDRGTIGQIDQLMRKAPALQTYREGVLPNSKEGHARILGPPVHKVLAGAKLVPPPKETMV